MRVDAIVEQLHNLHKRKPINSRRRHRKICTSQLSPCQWPILILFLFIIFLFIPGTRLSFVLGVGPSENKAFFIIKTYGSSFRYGSVFQLLAIGIQEDIAFIILLQKLTVFVTTCHHSPTSILWSVFFYDFQSWFPFWKGSVGFRYMSTIRYIRSMEKDTRLPNYKFQWLEFSGLEFSSLKTSKV